MVEADVISIHTPALFETAVTRTVALLRAGEVVALPTETVYGLAAHALEPHAVARLYEVKGRPAHNPIIVHVASLEMAQRCVAKWPAPAQALARKFWPGPLTLVLPRSQIIPDIVTAGGSTVGLRWPNHPFIQAVIATCGFPLAAPSANPASHISPTTAEHVRTHLGSKIRLIVDGGPTSVGIESTVVDLTTDLPRILRHGMISEAAIQAVVATHEDSPAKKRQTAVGQSAHPEATAVGSSAPAPLRSPGLLRKHYAPKAKLVIWQWQDIEDLRAQLARVNVPPKQSHFLVIDQALSGDDWGRICQMPRDPVAYARKLYAELHRCDELGAQLIVMEALPESAHWLAIRDRLERAASH